MTKFKLQIIAIILSFYSIETFSQNLNDFDKQLIGNTEIFELSSVLTKTLGSKSNRNKIAIKIPEMTEYILIQVEVDNENVKIDRKNNQELLDNLKKSNTDANTKLVGGLAILAFRPPSTGHKCDFFVFPDRQNFNEFTKSGVALANYSDNWKAYNEPLKKYQTESFNIIIEVSKLSDKNYLYLGFRNNAQNQSIKVALDAIAFIGNGWDIELKNNLYKDYYDNFIKSGLTKEEATKVTDCILARLQQKTRTEINNMPDYLKKEFFNTATSDCINELKTQVDNEDKAKDYGSLGWKAYEKKDFENCLKYSKQAIELDNSLIWVHFNIALVYLVTGKPEATDKYINTIQMSKYNTKNQFYLKSALKDIEDYEKKYGVLKNASDIKYLLKSKIEK